MDKCKKTKTEQCIIVFLIVYNILHCLKKMEYMLYRLKSSVNTRGTYIEQNLGLNFYQ